MLCAYINCDRRDKYMDDDKDTQQATEKKPLQTSTPLIFISHDSRDAELAEAFSKLLRSVSAGMLKSFRSSDKKGTEGIEYGDEWYKRLMSNLESASDVVCIFTERSLERPWILYEAGVAKGKLDTPVLGIALGVPLHSVSTGPFYQFQNCDDSEDSLIGLVMQLARRIPSLEPDKDVVRTQVQNFKSSVGAILSNLAEPGKETGDQPQSDSATARLLEELKVMFRDMTSRVEDRLADNTGIIRRRKPRRFNPMMFEEFMHMSGPEADPTNILIFASFIRDDVPWLYEIAMEAYRALISGTQKSVEQVRRSLKLLSNNATLSLLFEDLGMMDSKEMHILLMEGPRILDRIIIRCMEEKKNR